MQSSGFLRVLLFSLKSARVRAYVSERTQEQRSDGRLLRRAGGRVGGCRRRAKMGPGRGLGERGDFGQWKAVLRLPRAVAGAPPFRDLKR